MSGTGGKVQLERARTFIAKGLTVREAATGLKVGKTVLYAALRDCYSLALRQLAGDVHARFALSVVQLTTDALSFYEIPLCQTTRGSRTEADTVTVKGNQDDHASYSCFACAGWSRRLDHDWQRSRCGRPAGRNGSRRGGSVHLRVSDGDELRRLV
ncbi:MAG: hypothetical protein ACREFP_06315 [Acetobacteraceae bacterium]